MHSVFPNISIIRNFILFNIVQAPASNRGAGHFRMAREVPDLPNKLFLSCFDIRLIRHTKRYRHDDR